MLFQQCQPDIVYIHSITGVISQGHTGGLLVSHILFWHFYERLIYALSAVCRRTEPSVCSLWSLYSCFCTLSEGLRVQTKYWSSTENHGGDDGDVFPVITDHHSVQYCLQFCTFFNRFIINISSTVTTFIVSIFFFLLWCMLWLTPTSGCVA